MVQNIALPAGSGTFTPLTTSSRSVGGSDWMVDGSLHGGQRGVRGGVGLNNIGLLVTAFGRVTFLDPSGQSFVLWDGSAFNGAAPATPLGQTGITVWAPGMLPAGLQAGDFVTVTGISSCYQVGGELYPRILVPSAADIN